jgi:hypothetical protein
MKRLIAIFLILAGSARAQTVISVANEYIGNGSPSIATSGITGTFRFTLQCLNGGLPFAPDATVRFVLTDSADGKVTTNAVTTVTPTGMYRAETVIGARANPTMQALPYDVQFVAYPLDSDPVIMWWASLTVTSAPSAGVSINSNAFSGASFSVVNNYETNVYVTGGIVSNITNGTSNTWDAGTGTLTIDTNAYLQTESDPLFTNWLSTTNALARWLTYPVPVEGGTATVSAANGPRQRLSITTNTQVVLDITSKSSSNNVGTIRLDIYPPETAAYIAFDTNSIIVNSNVVISTVSVSTVIFDSPAYLGSLAWRIYQLDEY